MLFNVTIADLDYLSEIHDKELRAVAGGFVGCDVLDHCRETALTMEVLTSLLLKL